MNHTSTFPPSEEMLNHNRLALENTRFAGTNGVSAGAKKLGLVPAFLDISTGRIYRSRFADNSPAPIHLLEGLPIEIRHTVDSGFYNEAEPKRFYTRDEAVALGKS